MAAPDQTSFLSYVPVYAAAITAVPLVVSPIVAWALNRTGLSKESATIDYLNKRLDFLERINKLQAQFAEGPMKPLMDIEMEHCRVFVSQPLTFLPRGGEAPGALPRSRFARFFLTAPATSIRQRIFKWLFYIFSCFGAIMLLFLPFAAATEVGDARTKAALIMLWGSAFYFGIALLFRLGARPQSS